MELPRSCLIIAGPPGSGKTEALRGLARSLAEEGRELRCLLEPSSARDGEGLASGYALEFLSGSQGACTSELVDLATVLGPGELPPAGALALDRLVYERAAFARGRAFIAAGLAPGPGAARLLLLDGIGRLELQRGEGLAGCLELALNAVAGGEGPRALVCSVADEGLLELRRLAQEAGLRTLTYAPAAAGSALAALRRALSGPRP